VRIAILTGHGDKYRSQALELGANYYFSKPIDFKKHFFEPLGIEQ
jgi:CheY-like chemotaxis protein